MDLKNTATGCLVVSLCACAFALWLGRHSENRIEFRVVWWWPLYFDALLVITRITGMPPDYEKVASKFARALQAHQVPKRSRHRALIAVLATFAAVSVAACHERHDISLIDVRPPVDLPDEAMDQAKEICAIDDKQSKQERIVRLETEKGWRVSCTLESRQRQQ